MKMKILSYLSFVCAIHIYAVSCVSNTTYESMKIGVSHFNKAGNDFFNLIRSPLDPNKININDFKEFSISLEQVNKGANYYLSYYILLVIGVAFVIFMPITGLILLCCRCCKGCAARPKVMDPPKARCKTIVYGLILVILATAMLFGAIICLFNNQIVHEIVNNQDKSINIFENLKTNFQYIKKSLIEIKASTYKAPEIYIDSKQLQTVSYTLEEGIKSFTSQLVIVPELWNVIDQTKTLKSVLERENLDKAQHFVQNLNVNLTNWKSLLEKLKTTIKDHLLGCTSDECNIVRRKTDQLQLMIVNQTIIDKLNATIDSLNSADFRNWLAKIINFKGDNGVNMKLILDKELTYIKDRINSSEFSESIKSHVIMTTNRLINLEEEIEKYIPSLDSNDTGKHKAYAVIQTFETYRFYFYIGASVVILMIIVCYYLGLLYGTFGERPTEDASCCNRGVGARFLIGAIVLTFLFSSILMLAVVGNMLATGVAQTDLCRYSALSNENDANVLDHYIKIITKATDNTKIPHGIMDGLLNKCRTQNLYSAFPAISRPIVIQTMQPFLSDIDDKIVSLVFSQLNLTGYLNNNPFNATSSIDLNAVVSSIGLFKSDTEKVAFFNELTAATAQYPSDVTDMREIDRQLELLKTKLRLLVQYLNNSENEYIRWRMIGKIFDNNKMAIVKSKSSVLLSSIQSSLYDALNVSFNAMFAGVSCENLNSGASTLFRMVCKDVIDPLNGSWYGLGFYLLLTIPALIFACLLVGLYSRIQRFYPDKDEPDYDNYIGFYAKSDSESFKNNNSSKKSNSKGYRAIPLQSMS